MIESDSVRERPAGALLRRWSGVESEIKVKKRGQTLVLFRMKMIGPS